MDGSTDGPHDEARPIRNWPELREWANVFTAFAALALGVVSFWTTTQISGIEDYFRSEISRRNAEIGSATSRAERLERRVSRSEERLEDLRVAADKFAAASSTAQSVLLTSQQQLLETNSELSSNRRTLTNLEAAVIEQKQQIDTFRRSRVMLDASFELSRYYFRNRAEPDRRNRHPGQEGLDELRNVGLAVTDAELAPFYASIRDSASKICRYLENYSPPIPNEKTLPTSPIPPGKKVSPTQYQMTEQQEKKWNADLAKFNRDYSDAIWFNRSISNSYIAVDRYIVESITYCTCTALKVGSINPDKFCSSKIPVAPNIDEIMKGDK